MVMVSSFYGDPFPSVEAGKLVNVEGKIEGAK